MPRRIHRRPFNLVSRLQFREIHSGRPRSNPHLELRWISSALVPNLSVLNVKIGSMSILKKFTLDGRRLLAFGADRRSIEVYRYAHQGPAEALRLCSHVNTDASSFIGSDSEVPTSQRIHDQIFAKTFSLEHHIDICREESLCRESLLLVDESRWAVVASSSQMTDESLIPYFDVYRNNESLQPSNRFPIENVTLHLVDLERGVVADKVSLKTERIIIQYNQCLALCDNLLAVLSIQHQSIYIFEMDLVFAKFRHIRTIGRFCFEDDEIVETQFLTAIERDLAENVSTQRPLSFLQRKSRSRPRRPNLDTSLNSLKQRFLSALFRKAEVSCRTSGNMDQMKAFYQNFHTLKNMCMYRLQFIDADHLLVKYVVAEVALTRGNDLLDPSSQYFMVYNWKSSEVIFVDDNYSTDLVAIYEKYYYFLRDPTGSSSRYSGPNMESSLSIAQYMARISRDAVMGALEARRRVCVQVPIASQTYSLRSPYLDPTLFRFDERFVSQLARPKIADQNPIDFYERSSNRLVFRLHISSPEEEPDEEQRDERKVVSFIAHPSDPLMISVVHQGLEHVVNFHIRCVLNK